MNIPTELLPVIQITLPLILAIFGAMFIGLFVQNKRFDDIQKRLDDVVRRIEMVETRLTSIETALRSFGERIARLEERIPPLVHR